MRCHICNADTDLAYNQKEGTFDPCGECQTIIYETLIGYDDVEDDEDDMVLHDDPEGDELLARENFYGDQEE